MEKSNVHTSFYNIYNHYILFNIYLNRHVVENKFLVKGEFGFLRPWTPFLDPLLSNWMMVFSIVAFALVESEGSPKLLNLAA